MILEELLDVLRLDAEQLGKTLAMLCPWNKIFLLKLGQKTAEGMADMLPKMPKIPSKFQNCVSAVVSTSIAIEPRCNETKR